MKIRKDAPAIVKAARKKKNWTQQQAADATGVAQSHWSKFELGTFSNPRLHTLIKLANGLGLEAGDFFQAGKP